MKIPTFAISLQLFPASLMDFNLCSSAGLQGVFVLLFLTVVGELDSATISPSCAVPPGSPYPDEDVVAVCTVGIVPGAFRFLDAGVLLTGGGTVNDASSLTGVEVVVMPCCCDVELGESVLGLRLEGGEELHR